MLIGDKIRDSRIASGMTQLELANVLKCSVKTINRIEHNKKELTLEEVKTLNNLFEIDLLKIDSAEDLTLLERTLSSIEHLSNNVEDIKLEIIKNERIKTCRIIILITILFILLFVVFFLITEWSSPNSTNETIKVEYIYNERG